MLILSQKMHYWQSESYISSKLHSVGSPISARTVYIWHIKKGTLKIA